MPKEQCHFMLAQKAAKAATGRVARAVAKAPNLFLLGAVIMDTPLYAVADKGLCLPITERLHGQHGENPFEDAARVLEGAAPGFADEALSFAMGVVSHVMADAAFHPFVFYVSGSCTHPLAVTRALCVARHRRVETLMDTMFMNNGGMPRPRTFYGLASGAEAPARTVRGMAAELFGVSGPGWDRRVRSMMAGHCILQALFLAHPASHLVHMAGRFYVEKVRGLDALFYPYDGKRPQLGTSAALKYLHPVTGKAREATISGLVKRAVGSSVEVFERVSECSSLGEAAAALREIRAPSPETGLPGVGAAEMRYFDEGIDIEGMFQVG